MLSTKIRNTVIALGAFAALAGTLAPGASADYKLKYVEGHQVGPIKTRCDDLKRTYENFGTQAEEDAKNKNQAGVHSDVKGQNETAETAKAAGCGWAAMISPVSVPIASLPVRAAL
jgi:hypothetical protein